MNIIARLKTLRHREHECTVEIIESLVQCNREKAYLEHGCSTLWDFLVREMNYSNAAASRRYKAKKCAERFPPGDRDAACARTESEYSGSGRVPFG